jgi:hypothetical protein
MRHGEAIGPSNQERSALFYALLIKDLGCSSNASRFAALFAADDHDLKTALSVIHSSKPLESFRFVARSVITIVWVFPENDRGDYVLVPAHSWACRSPRSSR